VSADAIKRRLEHSTPPAASGAWTLHPTSVPVRVVGVTATTQQHQARRNQPQTLCGHATPRRRQTKLARAPTIPIARRTQGSRPSRRPPLSTQQRPPLSLLESLPSLRQCRHRLVAAHPAVLALGLQLTAPALPTTHRESRGTSRPARRGDRRKLNFRRRLPSGRGLTDS
jgi:hypothetical protein